MLKLFRDKAVSKGVAQRTTIALTLIILLGLMFPRGEAIELDYKVGAIWARKDLIAPFSFPIFRDEREYAEEVETAKRGVYPVFERDRVSTNDAIAALDTFFLRLEEAISWRRNDTPQGRGSATPASADSAVFPRLASQLKVPFSEL
jgi:hypothetical protein